MVDWLVTVISGVPCSDGNGRLVSHRNLWYPVFIVKLPKLMNLLSGAQHTSSASRVIKCQFTTASSNKLKTMLFEILPTLRLKWM